MMELYKLYTSTSVFSLTKNCTDIVHTHSTYLEPPEEQAERLAKKANIAWNNQTFEREVRDKREEEKAKMKQWIKSQQPEPSSSASAVPQKRGLEADDDDEGNEDGWGQLAREERS